MQRRHTRHGLANEVIDECVVYTIQGRTRDGNSEGVVGGCVYLLQDH